ncbi:MAG: flagellar biosynthesis/type III secretory pathway chaperone [Candidatus Azotimanducaceae bacterium]|jgi:flagellar biosynthesis/type III secretory pathway chaperone
MLTAHLALATKLRDSNLVNGKILNQSQNSIREIINILSGKRHNGLYGEAGQPMPDANSGDAIAKA